MTISDSVLLIFKAITSFVSDLNEIYGEKQTPLLFYSHLIEKTGIMNEEPIKKHLTVFRTFITDNECAILNKNWKLAKENVIRYSDKVYIDIGQIFELTTDKSNIDSIWQHLLTLSALLNPSGQAKEILRKEQTNPGGEEDFLSGLIDKVGKHVDPTSMNPMESMSNLMSSGVFTELMGDMDKGIENGSLDMQKMVGSLQKMIGSLSTMMDTEKIESKT
jgi:hypothetical protein